MRDLGVIADACLAGRAGEIIFAGPERDLARALDARGDAVEIDARGATVLPGFVDAHTHVVFAGNRLDELRRRLAGATYQEIVAEGGGILATVKKTRDASLDRLVAETRPRLDEMLRCGTTTAEAKSGYALTAEGEIKLLEAIARLAAEHPIDLVATFLGAHEVPPEYRARREAYVDSLIHDMMPVVAARRLAGWCDVFCEPDVFSVPESRRILEAAKALGFGLRVHADELAPGGGAELAATVGARSADHLIQVSAAGIAALARAGTVATLLPSAAFYLRLGRFAPARALIAAGVPTALASDVNPGGGHSPSMPFAITLACFAMQMTLEEAMAAATVNGAYALDLHGRVGSLEPGKQMDALILNGDATELLRVGAASIRAVVKRGRVVVSGNELVY